MSLLASLFSRLIAGLCHCRHLTWGHRPAVLTLPLTTGWAFTGAAAERQTQHLTINKALRLRLNAIQLTSSTIRPKQWKTLGTGHGTTLAMGAPDLRIGAALSSIGLNIMELAQGVV